MIKFDSKVAQKRHYRNNWCNKIIVISNFLLFLHHQIKFGSKLFFKKHFPQLQILDVLSLIWY